MIDRETYTQQKINLENLKLKEETLMLSSVLSFGHLSLKGCFILNGAACVTMLTVFSNFLLQQQAKDIVMLYPCIAFALGSFFATIASGSSYFAQINYQRSSTRKNDVVKARLDISYVETVRNTQTEDTSNSDKYIEERQSQLKMYEKEEYNYLKIGNIWRRVTIFFLVVSYYFFISGVIKSINGFAGENIKVLNVICDILFWN